VRLELKKTVNISCDGFSLANAEWDGICLTGVRLHASVDFTTIAIIIRFNGGALPTQRREELEKSKLGTFVETDETLSPYAHRDGHESATYPQVLEQAIFKRINIEKPGNK
jgi:hypothetical protein